MTAPETNDNSTADQPGRDLTRIGKLDFAGYTCRSSTHEIRFLPLIALHKMSAYVIFDMDGLLSESTNLSTSEAQLIMGSVSTCHHNTKAI